MRGRRLADFIFPPRCCGCDRLTRGSSPVCSDCQKIIVKTSDRKSACDICGMELDKCLCGKRLYFHKSATVFYHEGNPRKVIFKLKFHARPDIATTYSAALKEILDKRGILADTDLITCIPMTPVAKLIRGYNQSELIAKAIADLSGIEFLPVLYKERGIPKQHQVKNVSRRANVLGVFEPKKDMLQNIQNKRILIVDDVTTTGNTLNEAAKTLLIFGAGEIFTASCTTRKKITKKTVE